MNYSFLVLIQHSKMSQNNIGFLIIIMMSQKLEILFWNIIFLFELIRMVSGYQAWPNQGSLCPRDETDHHTSLVHLVNHFYLNIYLTFFRVCYLMKTAFQLTCRHIFYLLITTDYTESQHFSISNSCKPSWKIM